MTTRRPLPLSLLQHDIVSFAPMNADRRELFDARRDLFWLGEGGKVLHAPTPDKQDVCDKCGQERFPDEASMAYGEYPCGSCGNPT